jgi:hypothetical protein
MTVTVTDHIRIELRDARARQAWQPMALHYVGNVTELVLGGEGKISTTGGDGGEPTKKPQPSG